MQFHQDQEGSHYQPQMEDTNQQQSDNLFNKYYQEYQARRQLKMVVLNLGIAVVVGYVFIFSIYPVLSNRIRNMWASSRVLRTLEKRTQVAKDSSVARKKDDDAVTTDNAEDEEEMRLLRELEQEMKLRKEKEDQKRKKFGSDHGVVADDELFEAALPRPTKAAHAASSRKRTVSPAARKRPSSPAPPQAMSGKAPAATSSPAVQNVSEGRSNNSNNNDLPRQNPWATNSAARTVANSNPWYLGSIPGEQLGVWPEIQPVRTRAQQQQEQLRELELAQNRAIRAEQDLEYERVLHEERQIEALLQENQVFLNNVHIDVGTSICMFVA
jgi:hypothetical protein